MSESAVRPGTQLTGRLTRAVDYARTVHAGDTRKGTTTPYLSHLLAVSALVLEYGGDEDQAIAALLHDTAEDHGGEARLEDIGAEFGPAVADIVRACSDTLVADPAHKEGWWDRKLGYLGKLEQEPEAAVLVSGADKLHNARSVLTDYRRLREQLWPRFNAEAGRAGTLWYYRRLADGVGSRLRSGPDGPDGPAALLAADLDRTVHDLLTAVAQVVGQAGVDADWVTACAREQELA